MIRTGIQGRRTAHVCAKAKAPFPDKSGTSVCTGTDKDPSDSSPANLPRIDNRVQSQGISPSSSNASIEYPVTSIRYPEINHATSSPTHTMIQTDREKETGRQRLRGREKEQRKEKQMQRQRQGRSIRETSRNRRDRG